MKASASLVTATGALLIAGSARAAVVAGTYATINVSGSPSQFDSIPTAASNPVNPAASDLDPIELKIANDSQYVYFYVGYSPSVNPQSQGLYLAIDSDNNPSTGFAVYGSNQLGSNLGFENDFAFSQTAGNFNSNGASPPVSSVTATNNNGGNIYLASPYDTVTDYQIISLPLDLVETDSSTGGFNGSVFSNSFTLEFYTTTASATVLGPVTYTIAAVPEPASLGLLAGAGLMLLRPRRRKA